MDDIFIKMLAQRAKQDSSLLDKLPEQIRTQVLIVNGEITPEPVVQEPSPTTEEILIELITKLNEKGIIP